MKKLFHITWIVGENSLGFKIFTIKLMKLVNYKPETYFFWKCGLSSASVWAFSHQTLHQTSQYGLLLSSSSTLQPKGSPEVAEGSDTGFTLWSWLTHSWGAGAGGGRGRPKPGPLWLHHRPSGESGCAHQPAGLFLPGLSLPRSETGLIIPFPTHSLRDAWGQRSNRLERLFEMWFANMRHSIITFTNVSFSSSSDFWAVPSQFYWKKCGGIWIS